MSPAPKTPSAEAAARKPGQPASTGSGGSGKHGAGEPSDFATALATALISAARSEAQGAADAQTAAAIELGWHLAALAHVGDIADSAAAAGGAAAAGLPTLSPEQAIEYCAHQVKVALAKLKGIIEQAGLKVPEESLVDGLGATEDSIRREAATGVDAKAFATLSAVDSRLGKGYGVGRGLMALSTRTSEKTLAEHLSAARVAPFVAAIDDLSSALPPHAGHSVTASVAEWRASARNYAVATHGADVWKLLARQGVLWRTLLTGEKAATDMLEIDDYVDAAARLSTRMRVVAGRFLRHFWWLTLLIIVLFAGGIALLLASNTGAAVAAGAGSVLAGLGLTWRGVGTSVGNLAGKLERPLWGAELDTAVTQAITLLKRQKGRDTSERRRDVAVKLRAVDDAPS